MEATSASGPHQIFLTLFTFMCSELSGLPPNELEDRYSNAKMRFQSFFILISVQPYFFASS